MKNDKRKRNKTKTNKTKDKPKLKQMKLDFSLPGDEKKKLTQK